MQWAPALAAALMAAAALTGCEDSEKIPPDGSKVEVWANPATIPLTGDPECLSLLNVPTCGTSQVGATVRNELGVPLPGQDVRFRSTAGLLYTGSLANPNLIANLPIETDQFGNASVNLVTSTTTTVTAQAGAASGTLSINTVAGNLANVLLQNDTTSSGCSSSTTNITSCSQQVCLVATAQDSGGDGIQGVIIQFAIQNNDASGNTYNVTFNPSQATTDSNGKAFTKFTANTDCPTECGGKSCQGEVIATTQGGGFPSSPVQLTIVIP
jgi:hypothetical protein